MIYNDGFQMDDNLRVTKCPKCGNEQFDDELLRPYDEVEEQYKKQYSELNSLEDIDSDDLPF